MASHADWSEIIDSIERGDRAALLRLTNLVASLLSRMGAYRDGDSHEDLVQDIVLRLMQSWRKDAIKGSFVGYAWAVTRNRLIDTAKVRNIAEARSSEREPDEMDGAASALHVPEHAAEPGNRVDLARAVESLPEEERAAVVAIYLEGHSYEAAARQLGVPLGTLKRRQTAGLRALRKKMLPNGHFSSSDSGARRSSETATKARRPPAAAEDEGP